MMQSHHLVILKALTTGLVVTVCIIALIRQEKSTKKMSSEQAAESLRLTDPEAKFYKHNIPYICTITWMHGDYQSAKIHLQKRLEIMAKKNPWLLGCIKLRQGSYHLMYSKLENDSDSNESIKMLVGDEEMLNVVSPSSSPISRHTPLSKLNGILHESGLFVQNGPHEPLFKVSVIPCTENPNQRFALLVQLSHAVGDGATYYKLFNMLCSMEEDSIAAMIPERIVDSEKLQIDTLGKEESLLFSSGGNAIRAIRGMLACQMRGNTTQMNYGWVDASKMRDIKEKAAKDAGIVFVSTNDVITSWFMNEAKCPMGVMAINWRGRLRGHTVLHAGNYENMIFYNKEDFATPGLIRQSLTKYRRIVTGNEGMPHWYKVATTSMSVVTNWATFANPIKLEGCEEDIHLPLSTGKYYPSTMPSLIIFRASAGKIGLAYVHDGGGVNHLDNTSFVKNDEN